ncbi:MAG: CDP-alcohol phosphatidyltransferase family protein [Bacteroidia bacterium]
MKAAIPNLLTATNLFCGMLALLFVGTGAVVPASIALAVALVMDFADGFVARLLRVSSEIGKQLDSLADCVTFGVVPGFIMARMIHTSLGGTFPPERLFDLPGLPWYLAGFLIAVFSALRLARFNLDTRQHDAFYGVPTPANTLLVLSCWLIQAWHPMHPLARALEHSWLLVVLSVVLSLLLVADIRLIALKFHGYGWRGNEARYLLIATALLLLLAFRIVGIPFVFLSYLVLSLADNLRTARTRSSQPSNTDL